MPERLNGYWKSKTDPDETIYVEKVFKAGYVTGFSYLTKAHEPSVRGKIKMTYRELEEGYERK